MANKPSDKMGAANRSRNAENSQEQRADRWYSGPQEQMERWRVEHERKKAEEEKLAKVSFFDYEAMDYTPMLERMPWKDKPLPELEYMVDLARGKVEKSFFYPIISHVGMLLVLFLVVAIFASMVTLVIAGVLGLGTAVSMYLTIRRRDQQMKKAVADTRAEIDVRVNQVIRMNEEGRASHDAAEDERIAKVEKLINGDLEAVILRLDDILPKLGLPYLVEVNIEIYHNIFYVKIWLPAKSLIPRQTTQLTSAGRIAYEDKELRQINKQYLEFCAAIVMQIMSSIYGNLPSLDRAYVNAMTREADQDECLIVVAFTRENLIQACRASNGITAVHSAGGQYECDNFFEMQPIKPLPPPEWAEVEIQKIRNVKFQVYR